MSETATHDSSLITQHSSLPRFVRAARVPGHERQEDDPAEDRRIEGQAKWGHVVHLPSQWDRPAAGWRASAWRNHPTSTIASRPKPTTVIQRLRLSGLPRPYSAIVTDGTLI